jgi:hypothetical protein
MESGRARGAAWSMWVGVLVAACGSTTTDDVVAPSCNGVSPANLESEQTQAGQCPTHPTILTGTGLEGDACSDPTDCLPTCCTCPGTTTGADVAECSNGNCLAGDTACCLYALQCAQ